MFKNRNACARGVGGMAARVISSMGCLAGSSASRRSIRSLTATLSCPCRGQLCSRRHRYHEVSRIRIDECTTGLGDGCRRSIGSNLQRACFMTALRLNGSSVQRQYNPPDIDTIPGSVLEKAVDPAEVLGDGQGNNGTAAISEDPALSKHTGKAVMSKKAIEMEMRWLGDRVALASRISQILKRGDLDKAVTLVREAQRGGVDCMVAWNLLLEHEMQNCRPASAFKLFNEMKKRGRKPNPQTYTIILRGLAHNSSSRKAVETALSIYESLCSPTSGTKPSIIHTNAVLGVCARHKDMDALWEVAGKLPDRGYGAPDNRTYTIILNALKMTTESEIANLDKKSQQDGISDKKAAAVREGKRIWADVVDRWRKGELMVDQPLISAMGRLLVFGGREHDCHDALALFSQTMGIHIVGPRPASATPQSDSIVDFMEKLRDDAIVGLVREPGAPIHGEAEGPLAEQPKPVSSEEGEFKGLFRHVQLREVRDKAKLKLGVDGLPNLSFPSPTNSELSLILEACRTMENGVCIGKRYWLTLTSKVGDYKLKPDIHSFHQYLRLLRVGRCSAESLKLIRDKMAPQPHMIFNKTFTIALSTCNRDRRNPNVYKIAGELVDLMRSNLKEPDPRTLLKYVQLIRYVSQEEWLRMAAPTIKSRNRNGYRRPPAGLFKEIIIDALARLRPHNQRLKHLIAYGQINERTESDRDTDDLALDDPVLNNVARGVHPGNRTADVDYSITLLLQTKELHDKLLDPKIRELLSRSARRWFQEEAGRLRKFIAPQFGRRLWDKAVSEKPEDMGVNDKTEEETP